VISLTKPTSNGGMLANGIDGKLTYSRSQNGGITWNQVHVTLPLIDSAHYSEMDAESYAIDAIGNTVAIVQGCLINDWVLWKSTDDGDTWSRTVVKTFPIPAYDPATMISDVNGDLLADTIEHVDGALAVLIDNNNSVHCWGGKLRMLQETIGLYGYFAETDGLYYWNEGFQNNLPVIMASTFDLDNDSSLNIEPDIAAYEVSLTGMPSAAIDAAGNIYVVYSSIVEGSSSGTPSPQSYRNIYAKVSPDNGYSWSLPVNLMPSAFDECVYPSVSRNATPELRTTFQMDGMPGISGPIGNNDIVYTGDSPGILFAGIPVYPLNQVNLSGNIFYDINQNDIKDLNEPGMYNIPVNVTPYTFNEASTVTGDYYVYTYMGLHTVTINPGTKWQITTDSMFYTLMVDSIDIDSLDFGLYPTVVEYEVTADLIAGEPRCSSTVNYQVYFQNTGTMATSGSVIFVKDPQLTLVNTTPPYSSLLGDTIKWNYSNLWPTQYNIVSVNLSNTLIPGDSIFNCSYVTYFNGLNNDTLANCSAQEISCSFDPNDKYVIPEGVDLPHYTLLTDTLIYTIRFQNTGNDTAFSVRIRDTLEMSLDPATFHFITSSHPVQITHGNNGAMLFTFNNIQLPDSGTNYAGSNGFIRYSVKSQASTPVGTVVTNTAHIFFDYNLPISTNTTYNTLVDVIGMQETVSEALKLTAIPNPLVDQTVITFSEPMHGNAILVLTDIAGRFIKSVPVTESGKAVISCKDLANGMYYCTLFADGNAKGAVKIIKM
jgi:uncharacterized repeat protein (TIGR01451 family)